MTAGVCGCGHALPDHDDTGKCLEWWRHPDVRVARQCGCASPWGRVDSGAFRADHERDMQDPEYREAFEQAWRDIPPGETTP